MPKLFSARLILSTLKRARFTIVSQKGSHIKLKGVRNGRLLTVIVPNHSEVARGTFGSILRQADMTQKEFESYMR